MMIVGARESEPELKNLAPADSSVQQSIKSNMPLYTQMPDRISS
jgi:hypothetical protein